VAAWQIQVTQPTTERRKALQNSIATKNCKGGLKAKIAVADPKGYNK
jgi:hypothetical protein